MNRQYVFLWYYHVVVIMATTVLVARVVDGVGTGRIMVVRGQCGSARNDSRFLRHYYYQ
jgi:hypothetical protein